MKDRFPLVVMIVMGIIGFTGRFNVHPGGELFNEYLRNTLLRIISAFALILGLGNLIIRHLHKVQHKEMYYRNSYALLGALFVSAFIGLLGGVSGQGVIPTHIGSFPFDIQTLYNRILVPLGATMFSLLAFYMASAAYRSFRAKNLFAVLLLGAAFVVMIGQVPLGQSISPKIPQLSQWILSVPNTAAKRGIELGVTLGALATSLKILTGIERSWMGGGK